MAGRVKAVLPPKFDPKKLMQDIADEMDKFAPYLVNDFERVTRSWKGDKPNFVPIRVKKGPVDMILEVRVTGGKGKDKWKWLDQGTKPHVIRPKRPGYPLRFKTGYQAGSKPGTLFTSSGSYTGPEVRAKSVRHPGNAARKWTELIVKNNQPSFERWMINALGHAAERSAHSVDKK
jgi:hypothetical protein